MEPVRVGFVGGGEHARMSLYPSLRHAFGGSPSGLPSLVASHAGERLPELGAELVAVAEHKRDHAERISSFHGGREIYTDHREMLDKADVDCVIVCLHPKTQADVAIDCLNAGKHVWVEKPPAETIANSNRMKEAADTNGKIVVVGFMKRFSQPYMRAKSIVDLPNFGEPSMYEGRYTYGQYPVDVYDFLNGFCIHHLDLPRFFMGEIETVYAERVSRGTGLDGYAITLRFANDALGLINVNCLEGMHNNWSERVAVTGVGSRVFVENWRRVIAFLDGEDEMRYWEPDDIQPTDDANSLNIHGFVGEIRHFIESVSNGAEPVSSIENAIEAVRLQEAIKLSVKNDCRIKLSEVTEDV